MNKALRMSWLAPAAASLLLLGFYTLTAPVNHSEANDAYGYAKSVETATPGQLWHSQHLLYLPVARALFSWAHGMGLADRAYPVMVWFSRICGVLSVLVFFLFLKRWLATSNGNPENDRALRAALAGAGCLALSYGFWRYSNETEIYTPGTVLILLAWLAAVSRPTLGNVLMGGALAALAGLMHILNVLPALLVIPVFYLLQHRVRHAFLHGLLAGTVTGCVYLGLYGPRVVAEIFSNGSDQPEGGLNPASLIKGAVGLAQNVAAGNFLFTSEKFQQAVVHLFPYRALTRQIFTGQHADALTRTLPFLTLALMAAVGLALVLVRINIQRAAPSPRHNPNAALAIAAGLWFSLYLLTVVVTEPGGPENWVMALPPFWLLITVLLYVPLTLAGRPWLPLCMALLLGIHNYAGSFHLLADPRGDYTACKSAWLVQNAQPGDLILTADSFEFARYLGYHSRADVVHLIYDVTPATQERWRADLRRRPGHIFATADVFALPPSLRCRFPQRAGFLEQLGRTLAPDFTCVVTNEFGGVYEFNPRAANH